MSASWRIALASATGTSHEASQTPCQDSAVVCFLDIDGEQILVAVVSDGAGSAAHSEIGSELSVRTFTGLVQAFFAEGGKFTDLDVNTARTWIRDTSASLNEAAERDGHLPRDYSCTLLAAIVSTNHAAFVQVGDGAIVVSHGEDDGWSYVFWPQHGEYANTTNFIQSENVDAVVAFEVAPRKIDELALFSDGIENLVLQKAERSVHQKFFQNMIIPVRNAATAGLSPYLSLGLKKYLSSPLICERTDDDKTLILATRMAVRVDAE